MITEAEKVGIALAECKAKRDYDVKLRVKDYFIGRYKKGR